MIWMLEVRIHDMNTWSMYTWFEYVKSVYVKWIHEVYIHDMNTWRMYTWYEYLKYVHLIWIREVWIREMNTWSIYIYMIRIRDVCISDMNTWNMYNGNWCPWDTMFDTYMTWGSCNTWQTERKDMKRYDYALHDWQCICIRLKELLTVYSSHCDHDTDKCYWPTVERYNSGSLWIIGLKSPDRRFKYNSGSLTDGLCIIPGHYE